MSEIGSVKKKRYDNYKLVIQQPSIECLFKLFNITKTQETVCNGTLVPEDFNFLMSVCLNAINNSTSSSSIDNNNKNKLRRCVL